MLDFWLQAFISLFVIINPFAVVPVFVSLTQGNTWDVKKVIAKRSCIISVLLLLVFAFIGDYLMAAMKISEAAFRITGGFLLLLSAIEMVRSKQADPAPLDSNGATAAAISRRQIDDICVFPLAIPFLAGPGAITSTVILVRQASEIDWLAKVGLLVILVFIIFISYLCLIMSDRILKIFGVTGTNVLTRVFGIVLTALCVQNIINGIVSVVKSVH